MEKVIEKLRHGMSVTCVINDVFIKDGRVSIDVDGNVYICQNEVDGADTSNMLGYKYSYKIKNRYNKYVRGIKNLKILNRTIEDALFEDDIIISRDGRERKILGVCGKAVFATCDDNFKIAGAVRSIQELINDGYKLKQEKVEEGIVELTLQEIADLKGIDINKLRIKE